jgi:hypothetical protein
MTRSGYYAAKAYPTMLPMSEVRTFDSARVCFHLARLLRSLAAGILYNY